MNIERAQLNVNAYFTLGNERYVVTAASSFSGIPHYGFAKVGSYFARIERDGKRKVSTVELLRCEPKLMGWIPVAIAGQCEITM
jgi:hypothetical protein